VVRKSPPTLLRLSQLDCFKLLLLAHGSGGINGHMHMEMFARSLYCSSPKVRLHYFDYAR
jgi:hypothetical protein